jgi:site-specific DNA-methyltransferase (adenine-specific)
VQVQLYHGDCLDILPTLADGSVDAVITDPPYFAPAVHYQSRISWGRCYGDMSLLGQVFFDWCKEWRRVIKPTGHLFVYCNAGSYPVFYPVVYGWWMVTNALVWDKTRIGLGRIFRHQYELILWGRDSEAYMQSDGRVHSDILSYPATLARDRTHPIEKPAAMMAELISICVPENGIVLDCFAGSGTTGVACVQTGRNFIGIEIDEGYYNIAKKRIEEAQMQLRLL